MQMSIAIKKILYAADAKESALPEAREYMSHAVKAGEPEEDEPEEGDKTTNEI